MKNLYHRVDYKIYTDDKRARRFNDRRWFKDHWWLIPTLCQCCRKQDKLTFHHTDYNIPRVGQWLCIDCHRKIHGNIPNEVEVE